MRGVVLLAITLGVVAASSMNQGYRIANPLPGEWSSGTAAGKYRGKWFEVYSYPIRTKYAEVYWTMQDPVPLPRDIVEAFDNKVMAITGYEIDTVRRVNGTDQRVPCYEQYNHHYIFYLLGKNATQTHIGSVSGHGYYHDVKNDPTWTAPQGDIPTSQAFSEGNGNEYRLSFHGYPEGYAQLLESPVSLRLNPMMINTKNPDGGARWGTKNAPLPRGACPGCRGSLAPPGAKYSGLLECPCTDRKDINRTAGTVDGVHHAENCKPFPQSDLLNQNNTSCNLKAYSGGLACCTHKSILIDKDQVQPPEVDEFYMKIRFYYEEYTPKIQNLFRLYHETEHVQLEYDVPQCAPGTPPEACVHMITAHFKVRDMMSNCSYRTQPWCADISRVGPDGIYLIYAGPHCHAPLCLSLDLYNADTGELICQGRPVMGTGSEPHNEEQYIVGIPPCEWGFEPGMERPPRLSLDTNLFSVKRANSTYAHTGEMASWQMRGAYA